MRTQGEGQPAARAQGCSGRSRRDDPRCGHGRADGAAPAPTVKTGGNGDCKAAYAPRPTRDPNPMCRVPAARFTMGAPPGKHDDGRFGERPAFEVSVSPFEIGQFEVTVAQIAHYLNSVKDNRCRLAGYEYGTCFCVKRCWPGDTTLEGDRYVSIEGRERLPAMHVSLEGAQRYCAWAGKALPTEAQWEAAARFDPATGKVRDYPWGSSYEPNRAHERGGLIPVGSFDGTQGRLDGSSAVGVHDLAGSVTERIDGCWPITRSARRRRAPTRNQRHFARTAAA